MASSPPQTQHLQVSSMSDFPSMQNLDYIKRWLANLRGKAMPETFTWSYKRRYKKGYVWQDLSDDDHITPIFDNEYVLKSSQMLSSTIEPPDSDLYAAEKKSCLFKKLHPAKEAAFQMHHTTKTSFGTDHEPPPRHNSSLFDVDAVNINQGDSSTIKANSTNQEHSKESSSTEDSGLIYCSLFLKKGKINKSDEYKEKHSKEMGCSSTTTTCSLSSSPNNSSTSQSQSVPELGKSSKRRHLSMFRNLINCGAVNTNDAAFVRLNRNSMTYSFKPPNRNSNELIIIRKETRDTARTVGSAGKKERPQKPHNRTSTSTSTTPSKSDDRNQKKAASAHYRPMRGPHCSHCKKQFKQEKLHSHMKSCKGTKNLWQNLLQRTSVVKNKMQ